MAGTRSAPTIDGSPNAKQVSIRWIDYTGEKRSDSVRVNIAITPALVEAAVAAAQAISNASIYEVQMKDLYTSEASPGLASETVYEDIGSNMVVQYREPTLGTSQRGYIPSLNNVSLEDGTENVDIALPANIAFFSAFLAMLPAGYATVGARFNQKRDLNQQIKI